MGGSYMLALYGSRARGDDDCLSDTDMLYIGDEQNEMPVTQAGNHVCVSRYNWDEFEAMHQCGSLFLLHLKMQSRPISFDPNGFAAYSKLLATLPGYRNARKDIAAFRLALIDIREALESGDTGVEFELANLATTVRHATILGCYLLGNPEFGRYVPVEFFCKATGLPIQIATQFVQLYQFRMAVARRWQSPRTDFPDSYIENWLGWATDVVEEVAVCCEKNRR